MKEKVKEMKRCEEGKETRKGMEWKETKRNAIVREGGGEDEKEGKEQVISVWSIFLETNSSTKQEL